MPRIEGGFAIFPTDDGLLVLKPEGKEPVRYFFNDDSPGYVVAREMEDYLTLRADGEENVFHFGRNANGSTKPIQTTKVQ